METGPQKRQLDMLHGSIWNKLPLFALPVAATAILLPPIQTICRITKKRKLRRNCNA